jgi:hypothetical protein
MLQQPAALQAACEVMCMLHCNTLKLLHTLCSVLAALLGCAISADDE